MVIHARLEFACGHAALVSLPAVRGETARLRTERVQREKVGALLRPCDFCGPQVVPGVIIEVPLDGLAALSGAAAHDGVANDGAPPLVAEVAAETPASQDGVRQPSLLRDGAFLRPHTTRIAKRTPPAARLPSGAPPQTPPAVQRAATPPAKSEPPAPQTPLRTLSTARAVEPITPPAQQTASPAHRTAPAAEQTTSPAQRTTPPAQRMSPAVQRNARAARKTPAVSGRTSPAAEQTTSPAQRTTPPAQRTTPPAQRTSPAVQRNAQAAQKTPAFSRRTSPAAQQTTSPAQRTAPPTRRTRTSAKRAPRATPMPRAVRGQPRFKITFLAEQVIVAASIRHAVALAAALGATDITSIDRIA